MLMFTEDELKFLLDQAFDYGAIFTGIRLKELRDDGYKAGRQQAIDELVRRAPVLLQGLHRKENATDERDSPQASPEGEEPQNEQLGAD